MTNRFTSFRRRLSSSHGFPISRVRAFEGSDAGPIADRDLVRETGSNRAPSEAELAPFPAQQPDLSMSPLRALLAGWWILAAFALTAGTTTFLLQQQAADVYESVARFVVAPASSLDSDGAVLDSLQTLDRRSPVLTFSEIIESGPSFDAAATGLGLSEEDRSAYSLNVVVLPETTVVRVTVTGPDSQVVANLVNGIVEIASADFETLYSVFEIAILNQGTVGNEPIEPQPLRSAGIAFVLGAGVGALVAVARARRGALVHDQHGAFGQARSV